MKYLLIVFIFYHLINSTICIFGPNDEIYNELETRKIFDVVASAHSNNPETCLKLSKSFNETEKPVLIKFLNQTTCDIFGSFCSFVIVEIPNKNQLVIAFRGTSTMSQFFFEFIALFISNVPYFGVGNINYQFNVAHSYVWPYLKPILFDEKYKNYDFILSGHSLGGALATLTSARLLLENQRNFTNMKLLTFGEPRVGDFTFAKWLDKNIKYNFRVVNGDDLMAHLPPCHKDFTRMPTNSLQCDSRSRNGPYHHGTEIWYPNGMGQNASYVVCSIGEDSFCGNRKLLKLQNWGKALRDHRKLFEIMISYYALEDCDPTVIISENEGFLGILASTFDSLSKIFTK